MQKMAEYLLTHPGLILVAVALAVLLVSALFAKLVARMVVRRVFGTSRLPTIAESAQQIQQAQAEVARHYNRAREEARQTIEQNRVMLSQRLSRMESEVNERASEMLESVSAGTLPLTLVVQTPEDRQVLEAMVARSPRVVYRQVKTKQPTEAERARKTLPTAWDHILQDHDEDPCPTIETPKKARAKKKTG